VGNVDQRMRAKMAIEKTFRTSLLDIILPGIAFVQKLRPLLKTTDP
jgi:hypothetical protein